MKESLYSLLNIEISFKFHASTLTAIYLKAVAKIVLPAKPDLTTFCNMTITHDEGAAGLVEMK